MSLKTKPTYVDNDKVRKLFEKYDLNKMDIIKYVIVDGGVEQIISFDLL